MRVCMNIKIYFLWLLDIRPAYFADDKVQVANEKGKKHSLVFDVIFSAANKFIEPARRILLSTQHNMVFRGNYLTFIILDLG